MKRALGLTVLLAGAGCNSSTTPMTPDIAVAAAADFAMTAPGDMAMAVAADLTMGDPNCPVGLIKLSTKSFAGVRINSGMTDRYNPPMGDPWLANMTAPKTWMDTWTDGTKMGSGSFDLSIENGNTVVIKSMSAAKGDNGTNMGVSAVATAADVTIDLCDSKSPNKAYTLTFDCTGSGMGSSQADVPTAQGISGLFAGPNNKIHCAWDNANQKWISPAGTPSFTATADAMGKAQATFSATANSIGGGINGAGNSSVMATYKLTIQ